MNQSAEPMESKLSAVKSKISKISGCTLKGDYDVKLQTFSDPNSGDPTCTHHFKGEMKHNLLCVIAVIGGAVALMAAIKLIFRACGRLCCRCK